jgi:hypothetical protein
MSEEKRAYQFLTRPTPPAHFVSKNLLSNFCDIGKVIPELSEFKVT